MKQSPCAAGNDGRQPERPMGSFIIEQEAVQAQSTKGEEIEPKMEDHGTIFFFCPHTHTHTNFTHVHTQTHTPCSHIHSVHLLLVDQLGGVYKLCSVKHDDCGCEHAGHGPEGGVCQGLAPGVT